MRRALLVSTLLLAAGLRAEAVGPLRAEIQVGAAGTYEAVLPAGLHAQAADGGLDLLLLGPDGQARSLELYLSRGGGEREEDLEPVSYSLKGRDFVWEAALPKGWELAWLEVQAEDSGFSGTLKAELLRDGSAHALAEDQALFSGRPVRVELPAPYPGRTLRLTLSSQDVQFRAHARALGRVHVGLRQPGQGPATATLELATRVRALDQGGKRLEEASAELPGSGLQLQSLDLRTKQALIGSVSLGRSCLRDARLGFCEVQRLEQQGLSGKGRELRLELGQRWSGRELLLRLDNQGRATGVERLRATVVLPRVAFHAEAPGTYTLVAGAGQRLAIEEHPAAEGGATPIAVGPVRKDPAWKPESLLARFALKGGPFQRAAQTWKAPVSVPGAGYWRLSLPEQALLDGHAEGLRLEQGGAQVPSFLVEDAPRSVSLSVKVERDPKARKSSWTLSLPRPSESWRRVTLRAHGVFKRSVLMEWRRKSAPVWQPLGSQEWVSRGGDARLDLPLGAWTQEEAELRLTVEHGDNPTLDPDSAEAEFYAEALAFVSSGPGQLWLWGGDPALPAAQYDLDLLRQELLGLLPSPLPAPVLQAVSPGPWWGAWSQIKAGSQLWFYLSLAAVTLGLLFVIAKLLPRA